MQYGLKDRDTGIVDQDIEPTECLRNRCKCFCNSRSISDVAANR
jgi:hypothetical protein